MDQGKHTTNKGKWNHLSEKERYKIEVLYDQGMNPAQMAAAFEALRSLRIA